MTKIKVCGITDERGIRTREDVARLEAAGYTAFLVGGSLLRAPEPAERLRELFA